MKIRHLLILNEVVLLPVPEEQGRRFQTEWNQITEKTTADFKDKKTERTVENQEKKIHCIGLKKTNSELVRLLLCTEGFCAQKDSVPPPKHKTIEVFTLQKTPVAKHKPKPTAAPGSKWLRGDASDFNQCV